MNGHYIGNGAMCPLQPLTRCRFVPRFLQWRLLFRSHGWLPTGHWVPFARRHALRDDRDYMSPIAQPGNTTSTIAATRQSTPAETATRVAVRSSVALSPALMNMYWMTRR